MGPKNPRGGQHHVERFVFAPGRDDRHRTMSASLAGFGNFAKVDRIVVDNNNR